MCFLLHVSLSVTTWLARPRVQTRFWYAGCSMNWKLRGTRVRSLNVVWFELEVFQVFRFVQKTIVIRSHPKPVSFPPCLITATTTSLHDAAAWACATTPSHLPRHASISPCHAVQCAAATSYTARVFLRPVPHAFMPSPPHGSACRNYAPPLRIELAGAEDILWQKPCCRIFSTFHFACFNIYF